MRSTLPGSRQGLPREMGLQGAQIKLCSVENENPFPISATVQEHLLWAVAAGWGQQLVILVLGVKKQQILSWKTKNGTNE